MLSFLAATLNAALAVWGWFRGKQAEKVGRLEQQNDDAKVTLQGAEDANHIRQDVHEMSDDDLDHVLSGQLRRDNK